MGFLRKGVFCNLLSLAMSLHFLNFSIDPIDATPDHLPEDLAINEIESIAELILEDLIGFDNCFGESDEEDSDKTSMSNLYFVLDNKPADCLFQNPLLDKEQPLFKNQNSLPTPLLTISTPPPR